MQPNFELITELQTLTRRDFPIADTSLLAPVGANPLLDGEFLELDANYKAARLPEVTGHTGVGATKEGANALVFPVHTERGRYDTQAIGKVNLLMLGMYEAETKIVDATFLASCQPGDRLTVQNVTYGGVAGKRGLAGKTGAAVIVVGYVSKVLTGKIRFVHFANEYAA
jgi:hypothetical protein